jgi:hypothetical protein
VSRLVIAASIVLALVTLARQAAADVPPADEIPERAGAGSCHESAWPGYPHVAAPRTTLPSHPTLLVTGPRAALLFVGRHGFDIPYRIVESHAGLTRVEVRLDEGPLEMKLRRFDGTTFTACYQVSPSLSMGHHTRALQALVTDTSVGLRIDSNAELAIVEWSDGRRQISWPDAVSLDRVTPNGPLRFRVVNVFPDGVETTALESIYYRAAAPSPGPHIPWRGLLLVVGTIMIVVARRR